MIIMLVSFQYHSYNLLKLSLKKTENQQIRRFPINVTLMN